MPASDGDATTAVGRSLSLGPMSYHPKPCGHCGGKSFQVLPQLQVELWTPTTVLGLVASQNLQVRHTFTLVVCAQCTHTEMFTTNAAEIAHRLTGSYVANAR